MHHIWLFVLSITDIYLYNESPKQVKKIYNVENSKLLYVQFPIPTVFFMYVVLLHGSLILLTAQWHRLPFLQQKNGYKMELLAIQCIVSNYFLV